MSDRTEEATASPAQSADTRDVRSVEPCPCGLARPYGECCEPYHAGSTAPRTAETLMRSRYSAYVKGKINYLNSTLAPEKRAQFDRRAATDWSTGVEWTGLEILKANGGEDATQGQVEFIAHFRQGGQPFSHHELSTFKKIAGKWYFVDGVVRQERPPGANISRNALCPCGSGKKFKRCCG